MYLVRLIDNKELVGVYTLCSKKDLAHLVDETVSPYGCEYTKIKFGGIPLTGIPVDISDVVNESEDDDPCFTYEPKIEGMSEYIPWSEMADPNKKHGIVWKNFDGWDFY